MPSEPLILALQPVRRRLRAVRALEAGLAGAVGGAGLAAAVTVLRILAPQALPVASEHTILPLALIPLGFAMAFLVRLVAGVSLREAALAADRAAGLKERLSTALEVTGSHGSGLLDDRLLDDAVAAARRLDAGRLPLAAAMGRRAKVLLVGTLVLLAACFLPSRGGPPLAPQAAERAADSLDRWVREGSVAPAVREKVEQAVARLREAGARQGSADQATSAVYQALAVAERARRETLGAMTQVENADFQKMVRAAAQGDGPGAAGAAKSLADPLGSRPGSSGMPPAEREHLAASLTGAAATAGKNDLADLATKLAAAAEAVRRGDSAAGELFSQLAAAMTDALGEKPTGPPWAGAVEAVGQARRAVGLADSPPPELVQGAAGARTAVEPSKGGGAERAEVPHVAGAGSAAAPGPAVPANVRPEDRDVVRRYFGG